MVKFVVKRKTTYPHFRLKSLLKTFICNENYCILFYNTSVLVCCLLCVNESFFRSNYNHIRNVLSTYVHVFTAFYKYLVHNMYKIQGFTFF